MKQFLWIVFMILYNVASGQYPGLQQLWSFDNNDHTAIAIGNNYITDGLVDMGFKSTAHNHLEIPKNVAYPLIQTNDDFSLAFWVKPTNITQQSATLLSVRKPMTGATPDRVFRLYLVDNCLQIDVENKGKVGFDVASKANRTFRDDWNFFVFTYDRSQRRISLYLNGRHIQDFTQSELYSFFFGKKVQFLIGKNYSNSSDVFNGTFDNVMLFQEQLEPALIEKIYDEETNKKVVENVSKPIVVLEEWSAVEKVTLTFLQHVPEPAVYTLLSKKTDDIYIIQFDGVEYTATNSISLAIDMVNDNEYEIISAPENRPGKKYLYLTINTNKANPQKQLELAPNDMAQLIIRPIPPPSKAALAQLQEEQAKKEKAARQAYFKDLCDSRNIVVNEEMKVYKTTEIEVSFRYWDNEKYDRDKVAVYVDGYPKVDKEVLKRKPLAMYETIELEDSLTCILFEGHDPGRNTSAITIGAEFYDGMDNFDRINEFALKAYKNRDDFIIVEKVGGMPKPEPTVSEPIATIPKVQATSYLASLETKKRQVHFFVEKSKNIREIKVFKNGEYYGQYSAFDNKARKPYINLSANEVNALTFVAIPANGDFSIKGHLVISLEEETIYKQLDWEDKNLVEIKQVDKKDNFVRDSVVIEVPSTDLIFAIRDFQKADNDKLTILQGQEKKLLAALTLQEEDATLSVTIPEDEIAIFYLDPISFGYDKSVLTTTITIRANGKDIAIKSFKIIENVTPPILKLKYNPNCCNGN